MKTILASIVALGFMTSVAVACPHEEQTKQAEKKADTKQAQAPKAAPKAPTAPAKAPAKPSEAPKTDGKVSQR